MNQAEQRIRNKIHTIKGVKKNLINLTVFFPPFLIHRPALNLCDCESNNLWLGGVVWHCFTRNRIRAAFASHSRLPVTMLHHNALTAREKKNPIELFIASVHQISLFRDTFNRDLRALNFRIPKTLIAPYLLDT